MKKFIFFAILITGIVSAASAETVLADQLFFFKYPLRVGRKNKLDALLG